jgi:hypothetical protein
VSVFVTGPGGSPTRWPRPPRVVQDLWDALRLGARPGAERLESPAQLLALARACREMDWDDAGPREPDRARAIPVAYCCSLETRQSVKLKMRPKKVFLRAAAFVGRRACTALVLGTPRSTRSCADRTRPRGLCTPCRSSAAHGGSIRSGRASGGVSDYTPRVCARASGVHLAGVAR